MYPLFQIIPGSKPRKTWDSARKPSFKSHVDRDMQLTLAILKPDICIHARRVEKILTLLKVSGFKTILAKKKWLTDGEAEKFYSLHKGKFFYNRLTIFMTSGDLVALILQREDAINKWREMLGPTSPYRARHLQPNSIRALYGISDTRNVGHGSDCEDTARKEIAFFFPEFDYEQLRSSVPSNGQNVR